MDNNRIFNMIINNAQTVGNKKFAAIPLELLTVGEYQRVDFYNTSKVDYLTTHFDNNLMDPLKVSPHQEEGMFYVVDGMHRLNAAKAKGTITELECEILQHLSAIPRERLIQEADIFRSQNKGTDALTPAAVHTANLICGNQASIDLDNVVRKYKVMYKTNALRGKCNPGVLTGFSRAMAVAKTYGVEMLDSIFYVLNRSMWQMESGGLGNYPISMLRNLFYYDPETMINLELVTGILKEYSPKIFKAKALARYERRGDDVACSLFLEDLVNEVLPLDMNVHVKYAVVPNVA